MGEGGIQTGCVRTELLLTTDLLVMFSLLVNVFYTSGMNDWVTKQNEWFI